jgi:hypothetical protein
MVVIVARWFAQLGVMSSADLLDRDAMRWRGTFVVAPPKDTGPLWRDVLSNAERGSIAADSGATVFALDTIFDTLPWAVLIAQETTVSPV